MESTRDFNEGDFRLSAIETVDYFFRNFTYPATSEFSDSEISHIIDIIASVYMTKHNFRKGGGFVRAVISNNLSQAFSRADSTILKALRVIVYANENGEVKKFKPNFETI
jgi:hypothetical protein